MAVKPCNTFETPPTESGRMVVIHDRSRHFHRDTGRPTIIQFLAGQQWLLQIVCICTVLDCKSRCDKVKCQHLNLVALGSNLMDVCVYLLFVSLLWAYYLYNIKWDYSETDAQRRWGSHVLQFGLKRKHFLNPEIPWIGLDATLFRRSKACDLSLSQVCELNRKP